MRFFNPSLRKIAHMAAARVVSVFAACAVISGSAFAQGGSIPLVRDTEIEAVVRSYVDPIFAVAGLSPAAVKIYLVNDPKINAFVAGGQNIFVNTGLFMELDTPNQVIGVLAHETGHITGGHLTRSSDAVSKAAIPLLISMAAGIALMVAGAGSDAGMAVMQGGQQIAQRQFLQFTRAQESSADQAAMRYLTATKQSGQGMLETFERFAEIELYANANRDPFAYSHPLGRERIGALRGLVEGSPYYDKKDRPEAQHTFDMLRAKLRGYTERPDIVLRRYPPTDASKPARYARAMAFFRQPDMDGALREINSLIAEEPDNPYFLEVKGQIYVEMGRPREGMEPYRRAVEIAPDAPLLRVSYAAAMLSTEDPALTRPALTELEKSLRQDDENPFAWYEVAMAYSRLDEPAKASLATAERYFAVGAFPQAMQFAHRAQRGLQTGSIDWQRANDILAVAQAQAADRR